MPDLARVTEASLPAFCLASVLLAVTPGPGVFYIVARTLAQGRRAGLASVAGVACGNALNVVGASLGLAALFGASADAYLVVKYAGAGYLVWLGWRLWRSGGAADGAAPPAAASTGRLWRDGLVVAFLNPKTALFFAAFLPQFMDPQRPVLGQAIGLGGLFVAIAATSDAAYALLAARLAPALARRAGAARIGRRAGGASLIALGLIGAASGSLPPARGGA